MKRAEVSTSVRRVHSFTGAVPLLVFVVFHVWQTFVAAASPVPLAQRSVSTTLVLVAETVLVLVPLVVHAALGTWIATTSPLNERYGDRGSSLLQRITGVITLLFIGVHLSHTWFPKWTKGLESGGPYGMLWSDLGRPLYLASYVVGLSAVCFHLGQGVSGFLLSFDRVHGRGGVRLVRVLPFLFAFVLWVVAVDSVAYFATGQALLFASEPRSTQE